MTAALENSIYVDSELQAWIAPLSADEYAQLETSILEESAAPEVKSAVHTGAISIHAAAQIATLPRDSQAQISLGGIANIKKAAVEIRTINPKVDEQQSCLAGLSSVDPRQSSEDQAMIARPNGQPGRHPQVQGILASIFMGLDSSDPTQKTLENTIWVAQDLLEQAEDATALLGLCDFECPNECKECK